MNNTRAERQKAATEAATKFPGTAASKEAAAKLPIAQKLAITQNATSLSIDWYKILGLTVLGAVVTTIGWAARRLRTREVAAYRDRRYSPQIA